MVDGDSNPNFLMGHCFHGIDDLGGPNWAVVDLAENYYVDYVNLYSRNEESARLNYFLIGLTSVNYFPAGSNITRGTYPLCGQYKYKAVLSAKHTLKCNANLASYRYVIAQQPASGPGSLTICEMEVFDADKPNSKIWKRYQNTRLNGYVSNVETVSNMLKCLMRCVPGKCDSFNFKPAGSVCELNSHLNGYMQTNLNISLGWSFLEVCYA
ncbi:hypothetical protein HELRODRAFT_174466 [Helobdella robusta]|uniref:Apple domain-containing protein n=1 Tax=Helobdella robusta TaxID=6412 RepID=T1F854_HELRO|nr:hypothetical protein HELRODRAFT_174466 [Helobdella robusta]ESO01510.1 hypothetical protein HELRODRAFT_174466 [Helobdella robusta]